MTIKLIVKMTLLSLISGISVAAIFIFLGYEIFPGNESADSSSFLFSLISGVILSPLIETFIILSIYYIFNTKYTKATSSYIAVIPIVFIHALISPLWGVVTIIPFLVFTYPFRSDNINKASTAYWISATSHSLNNFIVITFVGIINFLAPQ